MNHSNKIKKYQKKRISNILENFVSNFSGDYISFEQMKEALEKRAFACLMLIFALPNLIPLPIPAMSTILGTPLVILSFQFMKGNASPWFPKWLRKKKIRLSKMKKSIEYINPYIKRFEIIFKPRLVFLVEPPMERFLASLCFIAAVIMSLPIPLANLLPATSIFLLSLAILERDGLLAILGISCFIASIALTYTILFTLLKGGMLFLETLF